jgi:hypothetical protein
MNPAAPDKGAERMVTPGGSSLVADDSAGVRKGPVR